MVTQRIHSIDILRGFVILLMSLGHFRHYMFSLDYNPMDLSQTTAPDFFMRWITHICAPAFVFLAGVSIYIVYSKADRIRSVTIFLLKRGLWLILLEITLLNFFWTSGFHVIQLQVIWVIGVVFLIMAFLIYLPKWLNVAIAISIILFHNVLDIIDFESLSGSGKILMLFMHVPGQLKLSDSVTIDILYSILPYTGIMLLGFSMGNMINMTALKRKRLLLITGFGMILMFLVLRVINQYGDPYRWSLQEGGPIYTFMSFLKVTKYPPSLEFILMTIGMSLVLLAWFEKSPSKGLFRIMKLGQVAMFFYIIHIPILRIIAKLYKLVFKENPSYIQFFLIWLVVAIPLVAICMTYERFKASKKGEKAYWWLRYI